MAMARFSAKCWAYRDGKDSSYPKELKIHLQEKTVCFNVSNTIRKNKDKLYRKTGGKLSHASLGEGRQFGIVCIEIGMCMLNVKR